MIPQGSPVRRQLRLLRLSIIVATTSLLVGCSESSAQPTEVALSTEAVMQGQGVSVETTLVSVPSDLVEDCVAYVQFGAFTANVLLSAMWDEAHHDPGELRRDCEDLGRSDVGGLRALSTGWTSLEGFFQAQAAAERAARTTTTPAPSRPSPATLPAQPSAPVAIQPVFTPSQTSSCGVGSYVNVDGTCVSGPVSAPSAPSGATAQCRDGTWSFSQHRSGTCSGHGGVSSWL